MQTSNHTLPPTRLARESLGLSAHPGEAPRDFVCPFCAGSYGAGSPGIPLPMGANFNDYASLAGVFNAREGELTKHPLVCGDCVLFMNKPMLRLMGAALLTRQGAFALRGSEEDDVTAGQTILNLILHPPEPPFVATIHSGAAVSLSHLIWRTPVTLDRRLIRVRYGQRLLTIRRHLLDRTLAIAERLDLKGSLPPDAKVARLVAQATERGEEWARFRAVRRLFAPGAIDFKLTGAETGRPSLLVMDACTPAERTHLLSLGVGEHYALAYLTSNRPPAASPRLELPTVSKDDLAATK